MRSALPLVALAAFLVGCATAPTPANSAPSAPSLAGFVCPTGQAIIGFDAAGAPVCGAPWLTTPTTTSTTTTTPTSTTPPQARNISLSQMSCTPNQTARFTVVSVSSGFPASQLRASDATTGGTLALTKSGGANLAAGDVLTLTGTFACTDTINFIDTAANTVVATITMHP